MRKHLRLTTTSKVRYGRTLFQLEIAIDCKWGKVGDKAGWVETEQSLRDEFFENEGWIHPDADIFKGGVIMGGVIWGGEIWGGEIWGGEIRGGEIWGGEILKNILQICGSNHFVNICAYGRIQIGCYNKSFEEWQNEFEQVGKENGYTQQQIKEYKMYIDMCIQFQRDNPDAIKPEETK